MKKHNAAYDCFCFVFCLFCLLLFVRCTTDENKNYSQHIAKPITVGVFDGNGGAWSCIKETVAAIRLDP